MTEEYYAPLNGTSQCDDGGGDGLPWGFWWKTYPSSRESDMTLLTLRNSDIEFFNKSEHRPW